MDRIMSVDDPQYATRCEVLRLTEAIMRLGRTGFARVPADMLRRLTDEVEAAVDAAKESPRMS